MLAGQIRAPGEIALVDVPEPTLGPDSTGEVLFEPTTACLCGSDLPYFDGQLGGLEEGSEYPLRPGLSLHEMVGTVIATTGSKFREGDKILAVPVNQVGLFERWVTSEDRAIFVNPSLPESIAVLAQPLGTVLYALKKVPVVLDLDVAVVGQGPMGQIIACCLRQLGARRVIAIDPLASRLAKSPSLGATHVIDNSRDDPVAAVRDITDGAMPDLVVEAVGHRDQQFNLCVELCRTNGHFLYFGVPPAILDGIRWFDLALKKVTVHTSLNPDFGRDFPLAMQWISECRIDLSPLVTHTYPLAHLQTAFETFHERRDGALKVILEFPALQ